MKASVGVCLSLAILTLPAFAGDFRDNVYVSDQQRTDPRCVSLQKAAVTASEGYLDYDSRTSRLLYRADADAGNATIMDFSHAGYMAGNAPIPMVESVVVVRDLEGSADDTDRLNQAIGHVQRLPVQASGFRGAILLKKGTYYLDGSLRINESGVVIRGEQGTRVVVRSKSESEVFRSAIEIRGVAGPIELPWKKSVARSIEAGSRELWLENNDWESYRGASRVSPRMRIKVKRLVTRAWLKSLKMDPESLGSSAEREREWLAEGSYTEFERTVVAVSGNHVIVDVPFTESISLERTKIFVVPYEENRISNIGIEEIDFVGPRKLMDTKKIGFDLTLMTNAYDLWIRNVRAHNFRSGVNFRSDAKRLTVIDSTFTRDPDLIDAQVKGEQTAQFADLNVWGSQGLFVRVRSEGASYFPMWTSMAGAQLNAVVGFQAIETVKSRHKVSVEPHDRWATGLLVDNLYTEGDVNLKFRGWGRGTGHGFTMAFGVMWRSQAVQIESDAPRGTRQWEVGVTRRPSRNELAARRMPASVASVLELKHPKMVQGMDAAATSSLFLAQLCQRRGPEAVEALGFKLK